MRFISILISLMFISDGLFAQLPSTDIFLFDMKRNDKQFILSNAKLLTANNPDNYNNQPHFIGDQLFITAEVKDANSTKTQTDIYSFDLKKKEQKRMTWTLKSEYSPMLMPDAGFVSVVCVEADDTQRIWEVPVKGDGPSKMLFSDLRGVGYYLWIDEVRLAVFLIGDPFTLIIYDSKTGEESIITKKPGRGLQMMPNGNLAYITKHYADKWMINEYNLEDASSNPIVASVGKSEDFIFLKDGTIIMASGSKLFKFDYPNGQRWKELADLSGLGITKITRIAINEDESKIALVSFVKDEE